MSGIANRVVNKATSKVANKVNSKTDSFFPPVNTDVNGWLIVDDKEYEIEHFNISAAQWVDYKG